VGDTPTRARFNASAVRSTLPRAGPSPHALEAVVGHGVGEALVEDQATATDALERLCGLPAAGHEPELRVFGAGGVGHPRRSAEQLLEGAALRRPWGCPVDCGTDVEGHGELRLPSPYTVKQRSKGRVDRGMVDG
jgi:hypothetical protein